MVFLWRVKTPIFVLFCSSANFVNTVLKKQVSCLFCELGVGDYSSSFFYRPNEIYNWWHSYNYCLISFIIWIWDIANTFSLNEWMTEWLRSIQLIKPHGVHWEPVRDSFIKKPALYFRRASEQIVNISIFFLELVTLITQGSAFTREFVLCMAKWESTLCSPSLSKTEVQV